MPDTLLDIAKILGILIVLMVLIELLDLPDWLGRKLRGGMSPSEVEEKIRSIEARLKNVEDRLQ